MDLRELQPNHRRHPWELARAAALRRILAGVVVEDSTCVLDVGCGDAYATTALFAERRPGRVVGVDRGFSPAQIAELNATRPGHTYVRRLREVSGVRADLLLLLDVLEHVEQDAALLTRLVAEHLTSGGQVLITVPAFQSLFGAHDRYMRHQRRYSHDALCALAGSSGLRVLSSGYLFASLLPLRALDTQLQRLGARFPGQPAAAGWRHGMLLSRVVERCLRVDNDLLLSLAATGVRLPGLTTWTLCRKP